MQTVRTRMAAEQVVQTSHDELSREVFGVLGLPIDVIGLAGAIRSIDAAIEARRPFLISTPNVNFLIAGLKEPEFRNSLLISDLCPVDGMPIVWIARLLGVPVTGRVSGADIFNALKYAKPATSRRNIFLFGGTEDTTARVGDALNAESFALKCVGFLNPGFGSVETMSEASVIDAINASRADILAVFLSAKKAQCWLLNNHHRLLPPVRAQFGATINFEAGTIRRAPALLRKAGLEWLWRIKEEPYLWRRYLSDGLTLLRLLVTAALPLALHCYLARVIGARPGRFSSTLVDEDDRVQVRLVGIASQDHVEHAIKSFRFALEAGKPLVVDLAGVRLIDPRFFGLLLMVRKELLKRGQSLTLTGTRPAIVRIFRHNGFGFLLEPGSNTQA